jgi:hypothetical protein
MIAPSEDMSIRFNTFYRNGTDHLREEEPGGSGLIADNILAEGGADPLGLLEPSRYRTGSNMAWNNASSGDDPGLVEADPLFVDPFGPDGILGGAGSGDDDFRLRPESPANDLGSDEARAVRLASHESLATRTTRIDQRLEGSGEDLAAANLGYHEALPSAPYASLGEGRVRLTHLAPADARVYPRAWALEATTRSQEAFGPLLDAEVVFLEHRLTPLETQEELLAAQVDDGLGGAILVRHWDGRRWSDPARSPFVDGITSAELAERRFDLEYEALSGRALFVFADGDGVPSFMRLERGSWTSVRPVAESAAGAGNVRWVELVPRAGSNELALVTLDDQRDLVVYLWDGASFSSPLRLEPNTLYRPSWRSFDAAFESRSGNLLVAWGFSLFSEEIRWATLERAAGTWRFGQHPSADAIGAAIVLAPDPVSDRIAATFGDGDVDNDQTVSVWAGSEWVHTAELTLAGPVENRLLEVEWIGSSGIACTIFRRQGHTGSFNVALFLPTGWRIQPDVVLPGVGRAVKIALANLEDRNHLVGLVLDEQGSLFGLRLASGAFSLLDEGLPLARGLDPRTAGAPFDVAQRHHTGFGLLHR